MEAPQHAIITVAEIRLPVRAVKVKNVVDAVRNVTWEVITGKVIVQGIIHKDISFVGEDGVVRQAATDVPFAALVIVPGVMPGMPAEVAAAVEHASLGLTKDGACIRQNVIVKVIVRVATAGVLLGPSVQQVLVAAGQAAAEGAARIVTVRWKEPRIWMQVGAPSRPASPTRSPEPKSAVLSEKQAENVPEEEMMFEGRFVLLGKILAPKPPAEIREPVLVCVRDVSSETFTDTIVASGVICETLTIFDEAGTAVELQPTLPFKERIFAPGLVSGDQVQVGVEVEEMFFEVGDLPGELEESVVIKITVRASERIRQTRGLLAG